MDILRALHRLFYVLWASHGPLSPYFFGHHRSKLSITCGVSHGHLRWYIVGLRTYVNCYFFSGVWMNVLYIILASLLSYMSVFFDRPDGESCVLSIQNFSVFVREIFRNMFGLLTVHFFDILCDATQSVTAIYFFYFRLVVSFTVFFGDRRWILWQMCNMKLLIIFGVSSCRVFRNGVGCLTIITLKFCDVLPVNFLDIAPCILLTNISIFVGRSQWFLFYYVRLPWECELSWHFVVLLKVNFLHIISSPSKLSALISFHTYCGEIT
jgi:hypothetical protein